MKSEITTMVPMFDARKGTGMCVIIVRASLLTMNNEKADYEVFNVGTGRSLRVLDIVTTLIRELGSSVEMNVVRKDREGDIRRCYADISKIWRELGFESQVKFEEGISELAEWAREDSPTRGEVNEFFLGEQNPKLLQIPKLVYHGFKCISQEEAIVINIPTEVYNYEHPDEYRLDPHHNDIPYDWELTDG